MKGLSHGHSAASPTPRAIEFAIVRVEGGQWVVSLRVAHEGVRRPVDFFFWFSTGELHPRLSGSTPAPPPASKILGTGGDRGAAQGPARMAGNFPELLGIRL